MKSFAFAYKFIDEEVKNIEDSDTTAECHFNVWKVESRCFFSATTFFFDIGLKISSKVESVYAYIPFDFEENEYQFDLAKKLQDCNQLLCTVFNADYKSEVGQGESITKVLDQGNKVQFYLMSLGSTKFKVELFKKTNGTIGKLLKINLKRNIDLEEKAPIYIRFRLKAKKNQAIAISEHISNDFLQAAFSKIDLFDFRINEIRNINQDVMDRMRNDGYKTFYFDKVHLFYMADSREVIYNGSSLKQDARLLEQEFWFPYLPGDCRKTNFIAYHWKKRNPIDELKIDGSKIDKTQKFLKFPDYRIFFSSIYPRNQKIRLLVYLFVVILLSWSGSMLCFTLSHFLPFRLQEEYKAGLVLMMMMFVFIFFLYINISVVIKIYKK